MPDNCTQCCDEPPCDPPQLICWDISATETKCGAIVIDGATGDCYTELEYDGCTFISTYTNLVPCTKYYLHIVESWVGCGSLSGTINRVSDYDCPTVSTTSCSGSITGGSPDPYTCAHIATFPGIPDLIDVVRHIEVSNEYTTALLKTNTVDALPEYPVDLTGICSFGVSGQWPVAPSSGDCSHCKAFANLAPDETSYTIRRVKFKIRHFPSGSCYLKVWLRTRFRPEGTSGASDVFTDLTPYEWTGAGGTAPFCLVDPDKAYDHVDNRIDSDFFDEVEEPATDGSLYVEIKKYSCLEGYEPDDPEDDGTRPDPDPNPNGWPAVAE